MNLKRTRNFIENEIDKDIMSSENAVITPAPNPSPNSSFSLLLVLGRERLTGPNYMDWMRNLRFTLRYENKEYVLDEQIPIIDNDSTKEEIEAHQKHYDDANKLKEMFQAKASKELLDVVKSLMACKPKPRASICAFVLEMKGYFDMLESMNMAFDAEISINIYKHDPVSLLQTAEQGIKKSDVPSTSAAPVLNVGHNAKKRKTSHSNWKGKATQGKFDHGFKRRVDSDIVPTGDPKEAVCFYCNTKGGLKESRKLKHGELNLVMRNRKITPVTKIGKYKLMLKSGVRINLNNCCYSSEMTRNIISFHALFKDGYQFSFDNENGDILVYSNGCFVFKASPYKGIYETAECIDNGNVILNVGSSNELDKSKLWHSRLGHINKKHIAQLQKDRVLELFDFKSDDVCESCLSGKMTKSPFTRTCERGEGLLDLVHTNVWGPFRSATKDGKRYYVTFTDDFSRYGYVYLIKHKSDTF
ncbi:retrotransposon protein, putative, ty1-copia subclass [Tanacetum coccineum]